MATEKKGMSPGTKAWIRIIVGGIIAGIVVYILAETVLKKPIDSVISKLNG